VPKKGRYVPPVDEKTIGRKLREVRQRRGITQVEMAKKLGISQSLYSEYERAELRLHAGLVAGLAKILGSSADELLCLRPSKDNGMPKDRRFMRRLQKIDQLPKRDRQALLGIIDAFISKVS
jgi:transcriptional regulator with XRE-family HTH domain